MRCRVGASPGSRAALGLFLLLLPCLSGLERPSSLGDVREVRHWSYDGYTRVVVELTRSAKPQVHRLAADVRSGRPERLYLDIDGIWIGRDYPEPIAVGDGLLGAIRLGQNTRRRIRVVLDLDRYDRHRVLLLTAPDRVVVDVYGDAQGGRAPGAPTLPLNLRPVRTVVLDPGHGGEDPGATGVAGLRERDVTLGLALALRPRLQKMGFDVVLTRDDDRTLSLEERTAIAEGAGGDLFVSLHANAARRPGARGIETYYLDKSHERHTLRVASHENGVPAHKLDPLQRTMASLRVSEVSEHSAELAAHVHQELIRGLRTRYRDVEDLGVKKGPFYVLFLSSMPAILVETGFLTHREEAKRLRDPAYIEALAERIASGVSRYRDRKNLLLAGGRS